MCITMKVKTVIPEKDRKQIEYYQSKIQERMESYFDDVDCASTFSIRDMTKSIRMMNNDSIIKLCEKRIENICEYSIPQTILITENEAEQEILKGLIAKYG